MTAIQRLNQFLESNCFNKAAVARKAGMSASTFYQILSEKQRCDLDKFGNICAAINQPTSKFMDGGAA
jgi:DNA-binding phage protein